MAKKRAKKVAKKVEVIEPSFDDPEIEDDSEGSEDDASPSVDGGVVKIEPKGALSHVDPVAAYMAEIGKYPLLSREEEFELAKKYYDEGDPKAAETLVTSNLRFVVKIAAEYSKFGAKLIDLIQEGNVGLMHAVKEFNPYKGVKLITYAVWWIRGYVNEYLMRQYSLVRIGTTQNQRKLFYQLQKEKSRLDAQGFEPDVKLLSSRLGIPEKEVREMDQRMRSKDLSLDIQVGGDDSGTSLLDLQQGDIGLPELDDQLGMAEEIQILNNHIEKLKPNLNEKEIFVLENRLLADGPKNSSGDRNSLGRYKRSRQTARSSTDEKNQKFSS